MDAVQQQVPVIQPASRFGDVAEYYFSRKLREIAQMQQEGKQVLNLGIGSPDLPPAPAVIETLNAHSLRADTHAYQSYSGIPELRKAFADWYRQWMQVELDPQSEVLPLMGSKEGIMHISMTYLEPGDQVLVPDPGYPAYAAVGKLTGAEVVTYTLKESLGWQADLEELSQRDLSRVKIMWLNYPNMPTGAQADSKYFERLVALAQQHQFLLVNDNPYTFILNDQPQSILSVPGAKAVALELNSLSKAHNMAGWRIGMVAGASAYLQQILRFKSNMDSGMFKPMQLAAVQALGQPASWYDSLNAVYRERRVLAEDILRSLGCSFDPAQVGMFVWAKTPDRYPSGYELTDQVLETAHVFLTPGGIFGEAGKPYVRISLCSDVSVLKEAKDRIEKMITP
ncbi:MAG: aminotransferase class I/II-fold pyridoxal phosphate-dependent enzyme [Saprospiraceae bacterium]|jgi:LL-diaminopimelate aminotransferase|nr:aminotransferase class I/II-fold pyridoxal phosphate-dependent enzyme [Saprospiraceae bacterium]MDP4997746.1 aminotransferase class I/II-fold pyridoxal phosphate-dependent enzyme [Saprospiraceae bacterium]